MFDLGSCWIPGGDDPVVTMMILLKDPATQGEFKF